MQKVKTRGIAEISESMAMLWGSLPLLMSKESAHFKPARLEHFWASFRSKSEFFAPKITCKMKVGSEKKQLPETLAEKLKPESLYWP